MDWQTWGTAGAVLIAAVAFAHDWYTRKSAEREAKAQATRATDADQQRVLRELLERVLTDGSHWRELFGYFGQAMHDSEDRATEWRGRAHEADADMQRRLERIEQIVKATHAKTD